MSLHELRAHRRDLNVGHWIAVLVDDVSGNHAPTRQAEIHLLDGLAVGDVDRLS